MICPCKDCERKGCGIYHNKEEAMFIASIIRNRKRRNKWNKKNW